MCTCDYTLVQNLSTQCFDDVMSYDSHTTLCLTRLVFFVYDIKTVLTRPVFFCPGQHSVRVSCRSDLVVFVGARVGGRHELQPQRNVRQHYQASLPKLINNFNIIRQAYQTHLQFHHYQASLRKS